MANGVGAGLEVVATSIPLQDYLKIVGDDSNPCDQQVVEPIIEDSAQQAILNNLVLVLGQNIR